jgi:hypothetical protein
MYDWVRVHGHLTVDSLVDETGYQKCTVSYPEDGAAARDLVERGDGHGRQCGMARVGIGDAGPELDPRGAQGAERRHA